MSAVAVAGGLGDLGRLIVDALLETGKYEVYILSRKTSPEANTPRISPLTKQPYHPLLQTDYSSVDQLAAQLTAHKVTTVICTFIMDTPSVSAAQLCLIRAAEASPTVTRFLPSEFNIEYNQPDEVLPYPEKKFHLAARAELGRTATLEYAYVYPGMFMDYFGMPKIRTALRPLYFFLDPEEGTALLPGDGEAKMSMTLTTDAARYVAWSLELESWPKGGVMSTAVSTVSLTELVRLVEKNLGKPLDVRHQDVDRLLRREPLADLAANVDIARDFPERFPGGMDQVRALVADLEASVALGAYDFGRLESGYLDLVTAFKGRDPAPKGIEEVLTEAWGRDHGGDSGRGALRL